jgi:hypothetical protein
MENLPADYFVTRCGPFRAVTDRYETDTSDSFQFTKHVYQDVYPSIDPSNPELSLAGKVAIVTGASRGIGAKVGLYLTGCKRGVMFMNRC